MEGAVKNEHALAPEHDPYMDAGPTATRAAEAGGQGEVARARPGASLEEMARGGHSSQEPFAPDHWNF